MRPVPQPLNALHLSPPQPQHSTAHDRQRGGASKPTALPKNSTKKQAALFDVLRTCPPVRICLYALGFYEQSLSDPPPTPSPCLALPGVSTNPQHHSKTVGREKVGVQKKLHKPPLMLTAHSPAFPTESLNERSCLRVLPTMLYSPNNHCAAIRHSAL